MCVVRLLVEKMAISRVQLLLDVHVSDSGGAGIPLDIRAAPLALSPVAASRLLFRPSVIAHGLLAHFVAGALLSAPQMLGSLELLLNPTGAPMPTRTQEHNVHKHAQCCVPEPAPSVVGSLLLLRPLYTAKSCWSTADETLSAHQYAAKHVIAGRRIAGLVRSTLHGLQDLVAFPLAAIEARSAAQFVTGVGLGSASLVRNLSGTHALHTGHGMRFENSRHSPEQTNLCS